MQNSYQYQIEGCDVLKNHHFLIGQDDSSTPAKVNKKDYEIYHHQIIDDGFPEDYLSWTVQACGFQTITSSSKKNICKKTKLEVEVDYTSSFKAILTWLDCKIDYTEARSRPNKVNNTVFRSYSSSIHNTKPKVSSELFTLLVYITFLSKKDLVKDRDLMNLILQIRPFFRDVNLLKDFDKKILSIDISNYPPEIMLCLLRNSYPFRKRLSNWDSFLIGTLENLNARGLNGEKVLLGLI